MWQRLRKLVGGGGRSEADQAVAAAEQDYQAAVRQAAEVDELVSRITVHGSANHIGERVNKGFTANLANLAQRREREA